MADEQPTGRAATQFKPGQSGNPKGRAKGSRNKLAEAFIASLVSDFQAHGDAAIEACRTERPHEYLKVIAAIVPKQIQITDDLSDLTDEQLAALHTLLSSLAPDAGGVEAEDRGGAGAATLN